MASCRIWRAGRAAGRVISTEPRQLLKCGDAAERLQGQVHDVCEGKIRPPIDDGPDGHRHLFADVAERVLAGRARDFYLRRFQLVEGSCRVAQDRACYLWSRRILPPSPQQRLRPVGNGEGVDDLVRGRFHEPNCRLDRHYVGMGRAGRPLRSDVRRDDRRGASLCDDVSALGLEMLIQDLDDRVRMGGKEEVTTGEHVKVKRARSVLGPRIGLV
jgi:hypothetical protein